jgi:hypothetical protein
MKKFLFSLAVFAFLSSLQASVETGSQKALQYICKDSSYPNFDDNALITPDMQALIRPYLLPLNHPMKSVLDSIFSKTRATQDLAALKKAGFQPLFFQHKSFIIVARHPKVPGYLFKLYLDSETRLNADIPGWRWFVYRCSVAEKIKDIIRKNGIRSFVVADKWIYPLPIKPLSSFAKKQPTVLLVRDMNLVSHNKTKVAWKTVVTKRVLDELYTVFGRGYGSLYLIGNLPYTRSGKFAFIDTEYPKRELRLDAVLKYLSPEMKAYWSGLIR